MAGGGHGGGHGDADTSKIVVGILAIIAAAIGLGYTQSCNSCIGHVDNMTTSSKPEPEAVKAASETPAFYDVRVTAYNLVPEQTDPTPCIGATGEICERNKAYRAVGRWLCATSWKRDANGTIVDAVPMGTKVDLRGIGNCEIVDRMGTARNDDEIMIDVVCSEGSAEKDAACVQEIARKVRAHPSNVGDNIIRVPAIKIVAAIEKARLKKTRLATKTTTIDVDTINKITSGYGKRKDPFTGETRFHKAVDVAGKTGDDVQVMGEGEVLHAGPNGGLGNSVTVRFGHLSQIKVKKGDVIKFGDVIGEVGSTGRSTAPHLHVEAEVNGKPVDPTEYVQVPYMPESLGVGGP